MLLAKQELAEKMGANDEKFFTMKKKYEEALKTMEEEICEFWGYLGLMGFSGTY